MSALDEYLNGIEEWRKVNNKTQVLLSYIQSHKVVPSTISDWLKNILKSPGINVSLFTAHSTRSATTSKPSASDFLSMIKILERGTWSNKSTSKGSIRRILSQYVQKIFKTVLWEEHNDAVNRRRRPRLQ